MSGDAQRSNNHQAHEALFASAEPLTLIVLRHGESEFNLSGIWQGQTDAPLSAQGQAQAQQAAAALRGLEPTAVISSDLSRAADTGRAVAQAADVPLTLDARLREINVGVWAGMSSQQVQKSYPREHEMMLAGEDFCRGEVGESVADVAARVVQAAAELIAAAGPGERLVVSTHGVAGRALSAGLLGLDQMVAWRVLAGLGNCHWGVLTRGSAGWRLHQWNVHA